MAINNTMNSEGKSLDFQREYAENLIIELAELTKDIDLPFKTEKWKDDDGETHTKYIPLFDDYENMVGFFYVPIIMALLDNNEPTEVIVKAPTAEAVNNNKLSGVEYVSRNYISLVIPRYIVLNFRLKIPAGTKFLICFVGGKTTINNISIIGLYGHEL